MKRAPRNLLFAGATLIFLVTAPILILYALGYRYDSASQALRKTGSIVVQFDPNNSEVFLDGSSLGKQAEQMLISGLTKSQYRVRVSKESYESWEKVLPVNPGQVTWAQNIVLFLQKINTQSVATYESAPVISRNATGETFAVVDNGTTQKDITFYSDGTQRPLSTITMSALKQAVPKAKSFDFAHMVWLPGNTWVLLPYTNALGGTSYVALTSTTNETEDLSSIIPSNAEILLVGSNNQIGFRTQGSLNIVTLKRDTKQQLKTLHGFAARGLHDFRIIEKSPTCALQQRNVVTDGTKIIANLACEDYSMSFSPEGNVFIASKKHLLYFNIQTQQLTDVSTNATEFHFAPSPLQKEDRLFFGNGRELFIFEAKTHETSLITRTQDPITNFLPNPTGTHVYFLNSNLLTAQEASGAAPLRSTSWKITSPLPLIANGSDLNHVALIQQNATTKKYELVEARIR